MSFYKYLNSEKQSASLKRLTADIAILGENEIESCKPGLQSFAKLISKEAAPYLEIMAARAQTITKQRFGNVMRLYAPIYVSNECSNECLYCGFRKSNEFERTTLVNNEIIKEANILISKGMRHILLVAGEHAKNSSPARIAKIARLLAGKVPSLSVEVAPFTCEEYETIVSSGVEGLTIYQETYDEDLYKDLHPKGKKKDYQWRLETPERGAEAGMRRINLGILLGLADDWRKDSVCCAMHIEYLMKYYWRSNFAVSVPRLCPCEGAFTPNVILSDREIAQLIFAYRIAFPDLGISLSTREPIELRDGLVGLGVTNLSAESSTEPGGYSDPQKGISGKQFIPHDNRTVKEIEEMLINKGIEPVWKDWEDCLYG